MLVDKTIYELRQWNPISRRYEVAWRGQSEERAHIQLKKPYYSKPRYLVMIFEDVIARIENNRRKKK